MEELVYMYCPKCGIELGVSIPSLEEKIMRVKVGRVGRVAHQLSAKRGPYYDRWKAAGGDKGNPNRCKDCLSFRPSDVPPGTTYCGYKHVLVKPWYFGCKMFMKFVGK